MNPMSSHTVTETAVTPSSHTSHSSSAGQVLWFASLALGAGCLLLIGLLKRLHENLPEVEAATARYVAQRYPKAIRKRRTRSVSDEENTDE